MSEVRVIEGESFTLAYEGFDKKWNVRVSCPTMTVGLSNYCERGFMVTRYSSCCRAPAASVDGLGCSICGWGEDEFHPHYNSADKSLQDTIESWLVTGGKLDPLSCVLASDRLTTGFLHGLRALHLAVNSDSLDLIQHHFLTLDLEESLYLRHSQPEWPTWRIRLAEEERRRRGERSENVAKILLRDPR